MAIDVRSLLCPQCGAAEVEMISDTQGICNYCGAKFAVQPRIENVTKEIHIHPRKTVGKKDSSKSEILARFTEKDFLRSAWIALAKEGAPLDIFSEDFSEIQKVEHEVVRDSIEAEVAYSASIGYDRQEPYIDYETYYEDEPYLTTESYFDRNTQTTRTRQVTKYKKVAKKRQVTKYKTVTDWSPISNSCRITDSTVVENKDDVSLNQSEFLNSFYETKAEDFSPVSEEDAAKMKISASAIKEAMSEHMDYIDLHLKYGHILPGDHFRDVTFSIVKKYKTSTDVYKAPEYQAQITFQGKTYKKSAFPFGEMNVFGDTINEANGLNEVIEQMKEKSEEKMRTANKRISGNAKKGVYISSSLSIIFFLVSIMLSIFVRYVSANLIGIGLAMGIFIMSLAMENLISKTEDKKMMSISQTEKRILQEKTESFSKTYRYQQRKALERKLASLGLAPLSDDDLKEEKK